MVAAAFVGSAILLAVVAALVIMLINNKTTNTKVARVAVVNSYQSKLASTLTPVVAANRTLSNALAALDGSPATIRASNTATIQAQQAVTAARGALAVLAPASTQLSQQATQALTQENGYLQAVSTTLDDPTGNIVASLQPLASATNSAFVALESVAPGGNGSISGVDDLLKWTQGANAQKDRNAKPNVIVQQNATTTTVAPTTTTTVAPQSSSGGTSSGDTYRTVNDTVGRPTISAGQNVSDGFARNILIAAATYYKDNGALPDGATLTVSSPTSGSSYNVSYANDGSTVDATNLDATTAGGNDVSFPASDANGTG